MKEKAVTLLILTVFFLTLLKANATEVTIEAHSTWYPRVMTAVAARLPNGSLLSVFAGLDGSGRATTMWGKLSSDGLHWSNKFLIAESFSEYQLFPSALLTVGKKTLLFYNRLVKFDASQVQTCNCSIWTMIYDGSKWQNDSLLYASKRYVVGTLSVLALRNNTLIFPFSWYVGNADWASGFLRSDNNASTWYQAGTVPNWAPSQTGLDEPAVVELSNGSLYCVLRCLSYSQPHHVYSISKDCGLTWSACSIVKEMFAWDTTPSLVRYSWTPNLILSAWINRTVAAERTPLCVALSRDDGSTWMPVVLDNSAGKCFNDMTFCLINETAMLSYRRYNSTDELDRYCDDAVVNLFKVSKGGFDKADFNNDGYVDIKDVLLFSAVLNQKVSDSRDMNKDGIVDLYDAILFSNSFNSQSWLCRNV